MAEFADVLQQEEPVNPGDIVILDTSDHGLDADISETSRRFTEHSTAAYVTVNPSNLTGSVDASGSFSEIYVYSEEETFVDPEVSSNISAGGSVDVKANLPAGEGSVFAQGSYAIKSEDPETYIEASGESSVDVKVDENGFSLGAHSNDTIEALEVKSYTSGGQSSAFSVQYDAHTGEGKLHSESSGGFITRGPEKSTIDSQHLLTGEWNSNGIGTLSGSGEFTLDTDPGNDSAEGTAEVKGNLDIQGTSSLYAESNLSGTFSEGDSSNKVTGTGYFGASLDANSGDGKYYTYGSASFTHSDSSELEFLSIDATGTSSGNGNIHSQTGSTKSEGDIKIVSANSDTITNLDIHLSSDTQVENGELGYTNKADVSGSVDIEDLALSGEVDFTQTGNVSASLLEGIQEEGQVEITADLQAASSKESLLPFAPVGEPIDIVGRFTADFTDSTTMMSSELSADLNGYFCAGTYSVSDDDLESCIGFSGHLDSSMTLTAEPLFSGTNDLKGSGWLTTCEGISSYDGNQLQCLGNKQHYPVPDLPFGSSMAMARP